MNKSDGPISSKTPLRNTIAKILFLYALVLLLFLWLLAEPAMELVRASDTAVFRILLGMLGAVGLNWGVYTVIHKKRPPLPVLAFGVLCLLIAVIIENEALPASSALTSTLTTIGGALAMAFLLLLSFWLAACRSRPAHATAVGLWILLGLMFCGMAYQVIRDIEGRCATMDTWITIGMMLALLLAASGPRLLSAIRRERIRRRATGLAAGRIVQIIGETHLDLDGDPVTLNHARIQFMFNDVLYETRADISGYITRKYGREAFIGRVVPVSFDPENPADAYVKRIDKHIFDNDGNPAAET